MNPYRYLACITVQLTQCLMYLHRALTIPTQHNLSVWALLKHSLDQGNHLARSTATEVCCALSASVETLVYIRTGVVRALNQDVIAQRFLQLRC
jgi:hypothetical protein